jgi:AcrR family transcriptional regulator
VAVRLKEGQPDLRTRARLKARAEVAQIAFDLFAERGFAATTATEAAAAAGISRASFFRLFSTKEEAVFVAQEAIGESIAEGLAERPAEEQVWTALRLAFRERVDPLLADMDAALARERLTRETAALRAHQLELHAHWVEAIEAPVASRIGAKRGSLRSRVIAGAAVSAFDAAVTAWGEAAGKKSLIDLIDKSFAIVAEADTLA